MIIAKTKVITRFRGDTVPETFFVTDEAGAAYDITNHAFKFTLNTLRNPPDTSTQILQLLEITVPPADAVLGKASFAPTAIQADLPIGRYYYDVQMTYPMGELQTIFTGTITIRQDITK
jgi:hypothetical protein